MQQLMFGADVPSFVKPIGLETNGRVGLPLTLRLTISTALAVDQQPLQEVRADGVADVVETGVHGDLLVVRDGYTRMTRQPANT
jgi:hypothetical protein